jgi:hypothetical protein
LAAEPPGETVQQQVLRLGRRIGIAIAGGLVIAVGVVLCVPLVPGPGLLVILLGLGILSLEFERPRIWVARIKARGLKLKDQILHKRPDSGGE